MTITVSLVSIEEARRDEITCANINRFACVERARIGGDQRDRCFAYKVKRRDSQENTIIG